MKKEGMYIIGIIALGLCSLVFMASGMEFDLEKGDVYMNFTQHNPINVSVQNLKSGSADLQFVTEKYKSNLKVSTGKNENGVVNINKTILASLSDVNTTVKNGRLYYSIKTGSSKNSISTNSGSIVLQSQTIVNNNSKSNSKQVRTSVEASGRSGKVVVNYDHKKLNVSEKEKIAK